MRVDIRPAIYSDIPKLVSLKLLARRENDDPDTARFGGESEYLTAFLEERQKVFVQLADRVPIAFCTARECNVKPFVGYAHIKDLYVHPDWQSKGYGKKLLMHVLRTMRGSGYTNAMLEAAEENIGARRFYERFGFEKRENRGLSGYITYTIDF